VIVQAEGSQPEAAEMLADRLVEVPCTPYRIFNGDVPTVADRIAQEVARRYLEPILAARASSAPLQHSPL
jgi:hypothetical protein